MNREEIAKEIQEYLDIHYKPKMVGYKSTDDGKMFYPEYNETIYPTIADYILPEKAKSYQQGVIETIDKITMYAREKVAIGYGGFGLLELCKTIKQSAEKTLEGK